MTLKLNYVKGITGKDKETTPKRTFRQLLEEHRQELASGRPLFTLGQSADEYTKITENDRESHFHIIGGIGQGKSKFLEYLIRHDINRLHNSDDGCGLCFLDGSEDGATMRSVLSYCAEIGFEKVLVIDPLIHTKDEKRPCINPFSVHSDHWNASVNYLVDAFGVVFGVKDLQETPFVRKYQRALFSLFHFVNLPPADLIYFTEPPDEHNHILEDYRKKREEIFRQARKAIQSPTFPNRWRQAAKKALGTLVNAYKTEATFIKKVGSTERRIDVFGNPDLAQFFDHREGVNFYDLVSKGWIILVNVDPSHLGKIEARLLGTIIINQIIHAKKRIRLQEPKFNKPYYIYIDEARDYVTYTLADILAKRRQIGIRTVLAHQDLGQLDDEYVRNAIINHTHTKCAFYIADPEERTKVFRMLGYGGELKPEEAAWNMQSQPKQDMVIRLTKQLPKKITVQFVPDPKGDVDKFLEKIFSHQWYKSSKDISRDVADRIRKDTTHSNGAAKPNPRADSKRSGGQSSDRKNHAQKDVGQGPNRADTNAQPDVAWESLFLEDQGDES
jgi:hypothetical protein